MRQTPSREEKLADIKRIALNLECYKHAQPAISYPEYAKAGGKYSKGQIFSNGDTWRELCHEVDLEAKPKNLPVADEVYFSNLKKFYENKGRLPKASERTKAGLGFRKARWRPFQAFVNEAAERGYVPLSCRKSVSGGTPPLEGDKKTEPNSPAPVVPTIHRRLVPPIPKTSLRRSPKWERIDVPGMPYAPQDESAVIALFAICCALGDLPYQILDITGGEGIDSVCFDHTHNKELRVEFKLHLSKNTWNHDLNSLDMVVCWKNRWPEFPKKVVELCNTIKSDK